MLAIGSDLSWSKVGLATDCLWIGVSALDKWHEGLDTTIEKYMGLIQEPPPPPSHGSKNVNVIINLYVYVPSIIYGVCFIEKCTLEFFSMCSSAYTLTQLYYYASSHYFPCILV